MQFFRGNTSGGKKTLHGQGRLVQKDDPIAALPMWVGNRNDNRGRGGHEMHSIGPQAHPNNH
jgi:hypothetical protein